MELHREGSAPAACVAGLFEDGLILYVFECLKLKSKLLILKLRLEMLEIWTSMGVKMAVTHFVMQFTLVSRHFGVHGRKQNKKIL